MTKRPNRQGRPWQRQDGRWTVRAYPPGGSPKMVYGRTEQEAIAKKASLESGLAAGDGEQPAASYRDAAEALWGAAGAYAHDYYDELRKLLYPDLPDQLPIVIGITAYGKCVGATLKTWEYGPRITLFSASFKRGGRYVHDIVAHEMLHASLHLAGRETKHNSDDWYDAINRLSPILLGLEGNAKRGADRKSVRIPNPDYAPGNGKPKTIVRKVRDDNALQHERVARWPHPFRPAGYYKDDPAIDCPSY